MWGSVRATLGLAITLLAGACGQLTETSRAEPECYVVVSASSGVSPNALVMYNKCTGDSWMLIKVQLQDADPSKNQKAVFTYRWSPITKEWVEPQLSTSIR